MLKTVSDYVSLRVRKPTALVAYKASADVVGKTVTLLVTVGAARVLAPEAFGVLALAMTTGWMLGVASDAGLPLYLARAVARAHGSPLAIVRTVMNVRIRFALAALAVATAIVAVWAPRGYLLAFWLIVVAYLVGAVLDTLAHMYRGLGRSEIESTLTIGARIATAVLVTIVLLKRPSLLLLSVALLVPVAVALIVSFGISARVGAGGRGAALAAPARVGAAEAAPRHGTGAAAIVRDAAPIGIGVFLSAIYFRCDVYFVDYFQGLESVGLYNAVFRVVEAMRLLPAAALAVAFPELCRATDLRPLQRLALTLTAGGIAIMMLTLLGAPHIVQVIYGDGYLPAAPALRVLALAVPLFFLNYALTHQVIAWERQRAYAGIAAAALATNIVANLALIPSQGIVGAAWATLITEVAVTGGCLKVLS